MWIGLSNYSQMFHKRFPSFVWKNLAHSSDLNLILHLGDEPEGNCMPDLITQNRCWIALMLFWLNGSKVPKIVGKTEPRVVEAIKAANLMPMV